MEMHFTPSQGFLGGGEMLCVFVSLQSVCPVGEAFSFQEEVALALF